MQEKIRKDQFGNLTESQSCNALIFHRIKFLLSFALCISVVLSFFFVSHTQAADEVGAVVNLRGTANILRDTGSLIAKLKDPVHLKDTIATMSRSRAKLLFIDESMLTIGSDSRASIEKFVYSKEEGGVSIFNLLDGKMRSVVGKTAFEVHTPTTVAAARGTVIYFLVGKTKGVPFTKITCLEGTVFIRSVDPSIVGIVELKAGQTMTVVKNQPLPRPKRAPVKKISEKKKEEAAAEEEAAEEGATEEEAAESFVEEGTTEEPFGDEGPITMAIPALPPIELEPEVITPVNINVSFP
jgi:hypothetical protein